MSSTTSVSSVREDWSILCVIRAANICGVVQIIMGFALVATGLSTFVIPPQISLLVTPFWAGFVVMVCGRFAMLSTKTKTRGLIRNVRLAVFLSCTVLAVGVCSCACIFTYPMWIDIKQYGCYHQDEPTQCVCGSAIFLKLESCHIITGHVYSLLLTNLVLCSLCISTVVSGLLLSLYAYSIFIRHLPSDPTESQLLSSTINGSRNIHPPSSASGTLQSTGSICGITNGNTNNNLGGGLTCGRRLDCCEQGFIDPRLNLLHDVQNGYVNNCHGNHVNNCHCNQTLQRTCSCSCANGFTCIGQETQI
ncbi:uncharacterized protein LOC144442435 [Glandiceps talaboti]